MIISLSKNYIFLKAPKTAGTSVEEALTWSCDWEKDFIAPHKTTGREASNLWKQYLSDRCSHCKPEWTIEQNAITKNQFDSMRKVSIIRNPWEINVSRWWMHVMKVSKEYQSLTEQQIQDRYIDDFRSWVLQYHGAHHKNNDEECYWFYPDGTLLLTNIIRYENLLDDYKKFCRIIDIPLYDLPKYHTGFRKISTHYREYYTPESRDRVASHYENTLKTFRYKF